MSEQPAGLHPAAVAAIFGVALWLTGEAVWEGTRQAFELGGPSPAHRAVTGLLGSLSEPACAPSTEASIFTAPVGHCQQFSAAYAEAPAHSLVVRHALTGDRVVARLLLNTVHVFGGISTLALLATWMLAAAGSRLAGLAQRTLLGTVYTLFLTGLFMFALQEAGEPGFFPRPLGEDPAILRYGFFASFALSFVTVVGHAHLSRPIPPWWLLWQHAVSFTGSVLALGVLSWQIVTLPMEGWRWSHAVEMWALVSAYPLLDLLNGKVLWAFTRGRPVDLDAHARDNLLAYTVLVSTVVLFFMGSGVHFFWSSQLPLAARLGLDLLPFTVWVVSGRFFGFVRRVWES